MRAPVKVALAVAWALVLGVSVPLAVCGTALLNEEASEQGVDPSLHGFYILQLSVAMGGLQLAVPSLGSTKVWRQPARWWSWLGGVCSLFGFVTVSAAPLLGVQTVITVQLLGILMTFLVLDILGGTIKLRDWQKSAGFAIVVMGVGLDNLSMFEDARQINADWILHLIGTFFSGVGYALQAKCNGALAQDVGGPARAAMVSAAVNFTAGMPIAMYIAYGKGVSLTLDLGLWPLWFFAGFQSAFYIGSMAVLPEILGFTTCYLAVLCSKLVCSTVADELALSGTKVPVSTSRVIGLFLVTIGAYVFNACGKQGQTVGETFAADKSDKDDKDDKEKGLLDEEFPRRVGVAEADKSADNLPLPK